MDSFGALFEKEKLSSSGGHLIYLEGKERSIVQDQRKTFCCQNNIFFCNFWINLNFGPE